MHLIVVALFLSILVVEYLVDRLRLFHPYFVLIPELLSGVVMIVVLLRIMNGTRMSFDWRYGLFIVVLLFTIAFGWFLQDVPTGAMLGGARSYIKFIPFFLLPAVHRFTPRQLQVQLGLLLVLALAQTPLALFQRFIQFGDAMHTGDPVRGTVTSSSGLSMFMVAAIAGAVVFYLRGRLRLTVLIVLCAWLFVPTTINETKATLLLLPVALLLPALLMPRKTKPLRKLAPLAAVGLIAGTAFVVTYNYFTQYRQYGGPLTEFATSDSVRWYLYTGAANTDQPYIGRFDSIEIAFEHVAANPLTLAFGFGAGNVSQSPIQAFAGAYASYYERFSVGATQIGSFLWEIGVVGLFAYLYLFSLVARDAVKLARSDDHAAPLGQLWAVAMIIMTFGLVYKSVFSMNDVGYLFWYLSGVVASRAVVVRQKTHKRIPQAPASWRLAAGEPHAEASGGFAVLAAEGRR